MESLLSWYECATTQRFFSRGWRAAQNRFLLALLLCALCLMPAHAQTTPAAGYWWNTSAAGSGFVIEVQGSQMFMAGFLYAASGEATWVASFGAMSSPTQYAGSLVTFSGGQTLTGSYQPPAQNPVPVGTIVITFTSGTQGTISWPGGTIPIQRLDFGPGGASATEPATNPQTGWWLNLAEGGRGFAVEVQNGAMYLAGYMYDAAGNPLWYLANSNMSTPSLFQGQWTQYGNGQTLTGTYQAPSITNANAGNVTIQFTDSATATLMLPDGRQIPLVRYEFGATPAPLHIAGIQVVGQPVLVFDHLVDQQQPNNYPDIQVTGWLEADGTVNITVPHFENYRMRGPILESVAIDRNEIFSSTSSASDIVESHYNNHHWLSAPYTFDGKTIYALAHTEWYACLLNGDCSTDGYQINSWANTVTSFMSTDGGASWALNGLNAAHVVSNESFTWTGSSALSMAVYRKALNHTGLMTPSRIVREGNYFYSIGFLVHRDFTQLNPATGQAPIDKYDYVLMRTTDITQPASWEGWVSGSQYVPMSSHGFNAFKPMQNGQALNAAGPQIIYDTNAQVYIVTFVVYGQTGEELGPIYYMTTPSLANPVWSDAVPISGSATTQQNPRAPSPTQACSIGFQPGNYPSLLDSHSSGFNFEYTDGDPWLFYTYNPALTCGDNSQGHRDLYRLHLSITYM
jgi:hypothetical protein